MQAYRRLRWLTCTSDERDKKCVQNISGRHLEDLEGNGRITLRWILVAKAEGGWNWFRILSNSVRCY
jgi:hypothetical protein